MSGIGEHGSEESGNNGIYGESKLNISKVSELGSSSTKEYLEFEPLKISLYELIMRQLIDDGLVEVAQLLHIKTKTSIPIHLGRNSLYNLYKTVAYLPADLRSGGHNDRENDDLLELKSANYVRRIESVLPHLENLTKQWVPVRPRSKFMYFLKRSGNYTNAILRSCQFGSKPPGPGDKNGDPQSNKGRADFAAGRVEDVRMKDAEANKEAGPRSGGEFYLLESISKIRLLDSWNQIPNISVSFRGNSVLSNHRPYCRALAVNPNGGFVATGGADGIVKIVPVPPQPVSDPYNFSGFGTGNASNLSSQQKTFTESKGIITALEYRIRRDVLISGDTNSNLIIYDVKGITGGNSADADEVSGIHQNIRAGPSDPNYFSSNASKRALPSPASRCIPWTSTSSWEPRTRS
ncbi:WD repeat-containing protein [Cryptosporidium felis]|nr:WD repeat-containing protein [Cryptosporidium felis]